MKIVKNITIIALFFKIVYASVLIKPIPHSIEVDMPKALLGKKLFFDPLLSRDGTISCSTCHDLKNGGDDNLKFSFGINGQEGSINAPTVYNSIFNFRQFWDGRAKDLKEQAKGPIENPVEMGHSLEGATESIKRSGHYTKSFDKVYSDGITIENIIDAIAEFEKALTTPDAPFDKYLRGDKEAISPKAKKGYQIFVSKGCIICHHGVNVGGNLYNKFGIYEDAKSRNLGRYNVTKREEDKYLFKVPSLRNIELTSPYMHDGRIDDLRKAIVFMSQYQLGRDIEPHEIDDILLFLKSLTGITPEIAK